MNYIGSTNTVNIEIEESVDITNMVATFDFGVVDSVIVNGIKQESGTTANDYSSSVVYTTYSGGYSHQFIVQVTETVLGINSDDFAELVAYPNPTRGALNLSGINGEYQIQLVNELGSVVENWEGSSNNEDVHILLNDEPSGVYFMVVTKGFNQQVIRVLKE